MQGDGAAESIIIGIHALQKQKVDVMIVGRGGGSIEDLWCFNEESVAEAVFDCEIPIISAVGHETDTTIIDYVADLRAPTPSAAAELAVYDVRAFLEQLSGQKSLLNRALERKLTYCRMQLKNQETVLKMNSPISRIREKKMWLLHTEEQLTALINGRTGECRHQLALYIEQLKGLSPLDKLNQGFSYVEDAEGNCVNDVNRVHTGDELKIYVKNGSLYASVTGKE